MPTPRPDMVAGEVGQMLGRVQMAGRRRSIEAMGLIWERELGKTVKRWQAEVSPLRVAAIERQVEAAVHASHLDALANLHCGDHGGAALVAEAARSMAATGTTVALQEAEDAGVHLDPPPPAAALSLADWARAASDILAAGLALGVGREALRLWRPGFEAGAVVDGVRTYLGGLTDRPLRDTIGGVLTRAQNLGRLAVFGQPHPRWTLELVADETLDSNTCKPCNRISGTVLPSLDAARLAYGGAGYLFCEGGERCRGTVVGVWTREDEQQDAVPLPWHSMPYSTPSAP